ncbi:hypothetical protein [Halomontanus rarus]
MGETPVTVTVTVMVAATTFDDLNRTCLRTDRQTDAELVDGTRPTPTTA